MTNQEGIRMKISRKARLIGAGLVIAVAGTIGGLVATESSANPLCAPAALSGLMGYWQQKENQATSRTGMQTVYGEGMAAELERGKLCHLSGFG
jgi:hypothetical protein